MSEDDRPSIAELQRLCRDEDVNHDASLALAAPVLLEIAEAAIALRNAYGSPLKERESLERLWRATHQVQP